MRRDIFIGIAASFAIHGAVWVVGRVPNPVPEHFSTPEPKTKPFELKPIEPDKPEPIDNKDEPAPKPEFSAPTQAEIFLPTVDVPFVQPPQPAMPDGPRTTSITIPVSGPRTNGDGLGEIYNRANLDQQPDPRYQAKPVYPSDMRHGGVTGQVVVGFVVDALGNVQSAYAVSSTQREFESSAVQAVSKWKFKPGKKGGRAVSTRMQVPVVFSISDDRE